MLKWDSAQIRYKCNNMKIREVARHELIGLEAEVHDAKNKSLKGIKGKVTDETKNTITIKTSKGK